MENIINIIIAYILGSIPCGLIIAYYAKLGNLRLKGSGNIGASNVVRTGNLKLGFLTFTLDFLKGFLAVNIASILDANLYAAAILSVLGHIFSIFLKFKGGKGVATSIGVIFALDIYLGIFIILVWGIIFLAKKISSLASIVTFILLPIDVLIFQRGDNDLLYLVLMISSLILFKHVDNIKRLLNKNEKSLLER